MRECGIELLVWVGWECGVISRVLVVVCDWTEQHGEVLDELKGKELPKNCVSR